MQTHDSLCTACQTAGYATKAEALLLAALAKPASGSCNKCLRPRCSLWMNRALTLGSPPARGPSVPPSSHPHHRNGSSGQQQQHYHSSRYADDSTEREGGRGGGGGRGRWGRRGRDWRRGERRRRRGVCKTSGLGRGGENHLANGRLGDEPWGYPMGV